MDRIKYFTWLLAACLATFSCMKDVRQPTPDGPQEDGRARVRFTINTPSQSRPGSRAIDENTINTIRIIVLKTDETEGFVYDYDVNVTSYEMEDGKTVFTTNMNVSDDPVKLLFLINEPPFLVSSSALVGLNEEAVRDIFEHRYEYMLFRTDEMTTMTGEVLLSKIDLTENDPIDVPLLRDVAKIEVRLNLSEGSVPFEITEIKVYQMIGYSPIFPDPEAYAETASEYDPPSRVIAPSLLSDPELAPGSLRFDTFNSPPVSGLVGTSYVFENVAATNAAEQLASTCIIVSGRYNESLENTYYRIDFNSGKDGHPFGQILRNYLYVFNITEVTGPGFGLATEALANASRSMVMEIEAWEENGSEVHMLPDGGYLGLYDKAVVVPYNVGGTVTFTMRTNLDFRWRFTSEEGTTDLSSGNPGPVNHERYDVIWTSEPSGGYTDYTFTVTAKTEGDGAEHPAEVAIIVDTDDGPVVFTVDVTQAVIPPQLRHIVVYSASTNIGSYGSSFGTVGDAASVKPLLQDVAHFGPGGTAVDFGGFDFDYDPDGALFTNAANADRLAYVLRNVDILVMPYNVNPTVANSQLIRQWLQQPGKVLFMSCETTDSNLTNVNLRTELQSVFGYSPAMEWHDSPVLPLADGIYFPAQSAANAQFFSDGLYASVTANQNYTELVTDNNYGYLASNNLPAGIIPLIYRYHIGGIPIVDPAQRTDEVLLAVDTEHRVVYIGESNLVNKTPEGVFSNIWGNIWAWAANEVLAAN